MIDYSAITEEVVKSHEWSGTRGELITALNEGEEVLNFSGGFEVPESRLTKLVPEGLPASRKPTMITVVEDREVMNEEGEMETVQVIIERQAINEDGEPAFEQKTWEEYAIVHKSTTEGEYLLVAVDYLNDNKCHRGSISSINLAVWANEVGISNVRTKSEFSEKILIESEEII